MHAVFAVAVSYVAAAGLVSNRYRSICPLRSSPSQASHLSFMFIPAVTRCSLQMCCSACPEELCFFARVQTVWVDTVCLMLCDAHGCYINSSNLLGCDLTHKISAMAADFPFGWCLPLLGFLCYRQHVPCCIQHVHHQCTARQLGSDATLGLPCHGSQP